MKLLRYGSNGWFAAWEKDCPRALLERLADAPPDGLLEYVPGFESLLLLFHKVPSREEINHWLESAIANQTGRCMPPASGGSPRHHEIKVRYDGPDLADVAERTGLGEQEVIERHSRPTYRVAVMGFAPGFPYLTGLDQALQIDRRASPRERIPAGSVAIGGPHAGIYPVASPGGWHLLGSTDATLFRPEAARHHAPEPREVFLFAPGDTVRFIPADA